VYPALADIERLVVEIPAEDLVIQLD